jgi:hypothetical protein
MRIIAVKKGIGVYRRNCVVYRGGDWEKDKLFIYQIKVWKSRVKANSPLLAPVTNY